ncbi:MAG TPA: response regulator [Methanosarcina sp.]|nr:response regulator [Methanosarcina sp.]
MKIREKTLAIVGVTLIFLFTLLVIATDEIVGNSFEQLENKEVSKNIGRATAAMDSKVEALGTVLRDYAAWEDTYLFMQNKSDGYIDRNFGPDIVTNFDANMALFYDTTNKLYYATTVKLDTNEHGNVSPAMLDFIAANELLFSHPTLNTQVSGILNSPEGPLLISSYPILKGSGEGPIAGTLIFAKYLDDETIKEFAETTGLDITIEDFNQKGAALYASEPSFTSQKGDSFNINYASENSVVGKTLLNDIHGKPALFLNVGMPRDVYQQGQALIRYVFIAILFIGLIFGLVLSLSIEKSVLSRISLLSTNLTAITEKGSLSSRINMQGKDELYDLAGNVNYMLQTLEEKEKVLKTLDIMQSSLDSIDAGIMVVGMDSKVIMNKTFIEMWSIKTDLLSEGTAEKILEYIITQTSSDTQDPTWIDKLHSASEKDRLILNLKNGAIYDWYTGPLLQGETAIGTIYCSIDITDSVRLQRFEEENRYRLETVLGSIISGILLIDAETSIIVEANPVAEEMIGLPKRKIVGNVCHHFICPADEGKCPIRDLGMKVDRSERVLLNKDGNKTPILKSVVPVTLSGKKYLVESFVDMTKIKEAEKGLIQGKIEAETANRAKSEFLATMSHELRTPLNSIIGFSDLMIGGNVGDIAPMQKKFLGNISTSGKHLLGLINNILDMSKIEAGKMELNSELFAVKDLFTEVEQLISPLVEKKGLKVEFSREEKLTTIYADKIRFKQILFNLASNAIKFTPTGGKITISSKVKEEIAQFSVTDTGIGISEEDKQKLFKPFTQVDSSISRKYEGTGLGLVLVKKFVELHGGNISCESEVGKGTTFTFEIPLKFASSEESTPEVKADNTKNIPEQLSGQTCEQVSGQTSEKIVNVPQIIKSPNSNNNEPLILIVEDDPASRELLETTLAHEGYRVATASNGKAALELADKMKPFAITLDIMMPGMNGWEVLKRLKLKERTNDIPVIITSMLDDRKLGVIWGAVEHFTKPIPKDELLATLEKIKQKDAKTSLKVLVVDDEKSAVELIDAMLDKKEFNVLKVYGGREAIDLAFKEKPEVIILDLMMPESSGFDVIKALKNNPDTIDIPIIVCTAKDLDSNDIKELSGNVSNIMHKGMFTEEELLECIKQIQKVET